jgi:hypothetical protein
MVVVVVQTLKNNFCCLSWQRKETKERKPQYGPSMVVGVVPTFKNFFVVYVGQKKRKKRAIRLWNNLHPKV